MLVPVCARVRLCLHPIFLTGRLAVRYFLVFQHQPEPEEDPELAAPPGRGRAVLGRTRSGSGRHHRHDVRLKVQTQRRERVTSAAHQTCEQHRGGHRPAICRRGCGHDVSPAHSPLSAAAAPPPAPPPGTSTRHLHPAPPPGLGCSQIVLERVMTSVPGAAPVTFSALFDLQPRAPL